MPQVTFSSNIFVEPEVTDTWVQTVECPCYDFEGGFNITLTWPSAEHPPWNATLEIPYTAVTDTGTTVSGIFVGE